MRQEILFDRVIQLCKTFDFKKPFNIYLRDFFRIHPEMGSRDRKGTRELCYNLLRIGRTIPLVPEKERLAVACFLCNKQSDELIDYLLARHSSLTSSPIGNSIEEKIEVVKKNYSGFSLSDVFTMSDLLSTEIEKESWKKSFLKKPDVFIRIREKHSNEVLEEFKSKNISFEVTNLKNCFRIKPEEKLNKTSAFEKGYFEIQDINSQKTFSFFDASEGERWWDACAGSGGKSLMLMDRVKAISILATDKRPAILENFKIRASRTGGKNFQTSVFDFENQQKKVSETFDGIIADVPCSGSGTWSRNPEWLQKDTTNDILAYFVPLQRKIVSVLIASLKKGKPLIYITCSAFFSENEENIRHFTNQLPLRLEKSAYLDGYQTGADTLFVAKLIRI